MMKLEVKMMKFIRLFIWYIVIFCILIFNSSCSKGKSADEKTGAKEKFDMKVASNIIDTYMGYIMQDDIENATKLYGKEILEKYKSAESTDLKVLGYKIDEINEVGRSGLFKVRVTKSSSSKSAAVLDMYSIKVEKEDNEYKIGDIKSSTEKAAITEDNSIRVRDKDNIKTNLLIDTTGIPQYSYPKDDVAKISKVMVPKNNFGIINYAYSGEKIAISTFDKDAYVGIVKIDETLATQGGSSSGGSEGQGGAQGGGGASGSINKARETPVGKEITGIDLIKDGKVELVSFSLEEKYVVVQFEKTNMGKSIRLYDADSGELLPSKIEEEFPIDKVDVVFSSFGKDALNFEVLEKKDTDKSQAQMIGKWQIDLKELKMKKL